jgi:hypothetical protein
MPPKEAAACRCRYRMRGLSEYLLSDPLLKCGSGHEADSARHLLHWSNSARQSGDAVEWIVGYLDLPLGIPAGYAPSEIYLATTDLTASAGPKSLAATLQDGLILDHRDGRVELKAGPGPNTFVARTARWSASLATNLVVRDPLLRSKSFIFR